MAMATRFIGNKIFLTLLLFAALIWIFQLDYRQPNPEFSFCIFHQLTGINCYGCGFIRGVAACMHLDFRAAWHLNPLNLLTIPLIGYLVLHSLFIPQQKKQDAPSV
jgi:hypothetical protein